MLTRLVRVTLEAQIPATISAVVYLGAFREFWRIRHLEKYTPAAPLNWEPLTAVTRKSTPVTIAIVYFQSKLYAVGLLYSLNARQLLQKIGRQDLADASSRYDFQTPGTNTVDVSNEMEAPDERCDEMKV
jgi:hypothetical protein